MTHSLVKKGPIHFVANFIGIGFFCVCSSAVYPARAEMAGEAGASPPANLQQCREVCQQTSLCGGPTELGCCTSFCTVDAEFNALLTESDSPKRTKRLCEVIGVYREAVRRKSADVQRTPPVLSIKIGIIKAALGFPDEAEADLSSVNALISDTSVPGLALQSRFGMTQESVQNNYAPGLKRLQKEISTARQKPPAGATSSRTYCETVVAQKRDASDPVRAAAPTRDAVPGAESPRSSASGPAEDPSAAARPQGQAATNVALNRQTAASPAASTAASVQSKSAPPVVASAPVAARQSSSLPLGVLEVGGKRAGAEPAVPSVQTTRRRCGTGCGIAVGIGGTVVLAGLVTGIVYISKAIQLSRTPALSSELRSPLFFLGEANLR